MCWDAKGGGGAGGGAGGAEKKSKNVSSYVCLKMSVFCAMHPFSPPNIAVQFAYVSNSTFYTLSVIPDFLGELSIVRIRCS